MHFLSGLPRSGSTVLSSILNQNPHIHSTSTSGLVEILGAACIAWEKSPTTIAQGMNTDQAYSMLRSIMQDKYKNISKPIIIDKNRSWVDPSIIKTMSHVLGRPPKIIATVRSTTDCAASFVRVAKPENLDLFLNSSPLIQHLKSSYSLLKRGYEAYPDNIHFVDYDNLIKSPQDEMNKIHSFLGLEFYNYDFNNIDTTIVAENDEDAWGITNLHKISSVLKYQQNNTAKEILKEHYDNFDQPNFWNRSSSNIEIKQKKVDIAVEYLNQGKIEESYKLLIECHKENPLCHKTAFHLGWHLLNKNNLQQGIQYLTRGRFINCFGDPKPNITTEIWDGFSKGTILYYLEGTIADQIHALKFVNILSQKNKIIVACSSELFEIANQCCGDISLVDRKCVFGVYHDYWIPSLSVLIPLQYEYKNINTNPHIKQKLKVKNKKIKIGICLLDKHEYFLNKLNTLDVNCVSLNIFNNVEYDNIPKCSTIHNWKDMMTKISECDLIISDSPEISILSGAMGIETWVFVPFISHYLFLENKNNKNFYYNTVYSFKQNKINCWKTPSDDMLIQLNKKINAKNIWNNICQKLLK